FMDGVASERGELPQVGDCDDGRVELLVDDLEQMLRLPIAERNSLRVSSLLGVGAALFSSIEDIGDDAKWYGFKQGDNHDGPQLTGNQHCSSVIVFPKSGVAVARA